MTSLSLLTSKNELIGSYQTKPRRSVTTRPTGDAEVALSGVYVGKVQAYLSTALLVLMQHQPQKVNGIATSTIKRRSRLALRTKNTSQCRGDNMSFDQIIEEFHRLSESRSNVLKTIRDSENEITSISERIDELMGYSEDRKRTQEFKDQVSKAKDKRKRIRQEIAEHEHNVRMYEAKIQSLKMRIQRGGKDET